MSKEEDFDLNFFYIRQAINGWVITKDGPEHYIMAPNFYVFRTLDEMFSWIREQTENKKEYPEK